MKIRRGDVKAVFPLPPNAVLGFEAAGVVDFRMAEAADAHRLLESGGTHEKLVLEPSRWLRGKH